MHAYANAPLACNARTHIHTHVHTRAHGVERSEIPRAERDSARAVFFTFTRVSLGRS